MYLEIYMLFFEDPDIQLIVSSSKGDFIEFWNLVYLITRVGQRARQLSYIKLPFFS